MSSVRKKTVKSHPESSSTGLRKENKELRSRLAEIEHIQRIREEKREREHRMKYLSMINCIADPVFIYDAITYRFLHCNEAVLDNYGYSKEEILSMTPFDLHRPEDFEEVRKNIDKRIAGSAGTFTHFTKDHKPRMVEITSTDIYFDEKPAWMIIAHDITERTMMEMELKKYRSHLEEMVNERTIEVLLANKQLKEQVQERIKAELAIMESEKKFRDLIEKSRDGIILVDEKGSIIEWNSGQENIYGPKRAMVVGKKIWDVQFQHEPSEIRNEKKYKEIKGQWQNFFKTGNNPFKNDLLINRIETSQKKIKDIQQLYFTIETDQGAMMACTTRDITEKLLMEKQLIQTQKMEAMGTLAGGIAHDFNNVLGGIIGYTDLALRKIPKDSPVRRYLDQVLTASHRATDLVKQILTFSRQEAEEKKVPVQLGGIVNEALKLLHSTVSETIEIISKIEASDSYIQANPTQFHQVIMNLCTNAAHAIGEKEGIIEVKLTEEIIDDGLYKGLKPGPHLRLTINDTGQGIKAEHLEKIFDPFFTTKKPGEGTGMGLAVVHGIIEGHHGHISVFSQEGEGTTFSILVPIIVDFIHTKEKSEAPIPGGNESILLVEDDTYLCEAEKKMLQELGYKVTALISSTEAYEIFRKLPERFNIIISDYAMPKMTGLQLIQKIRPIRPNIPVIICTGYDKVASLKKTTPLKESEIILKPIELGNIANTIRRLLDKN